MNTWPCKLTGHTTGYNKRPRRIDAVIDGGSDVVAAAYAYMRRRRNSHEWLGVGLTVTDPTGRQTAFVYEPNERS